VPRIYHHALGVHIDALPGQTKALLKRGWSLQAKPPRPPRKKWTAPVLVERTDPVEAFAETAEVPEGDTNPTPTEEGTS